MESNQVSRSYIVSDGASYTLRNFNDIVKNILKKKTFRITIPSSVARPIAFASESFSLLTGISTSFNRERLKEFEAANWLCNIDSLKTDLNFIPDYSLETGLRETLSWYKKNNWL
ncbi:MAG: hypothetical protein JJE25_14010 [Bacteroidia bacterium]|nr:hypothetical protein [Bacteroidia bacterium]